MNTQSHEEPKQIQFNNNPFSLTFEAMTRAFRINQALAITVLVGGIIMGLGNQILNYTPDVFNAVARNSDESVAAVLTAISVVLTLFLVLLSLFVNIVWVGFTAFAGLRNARYEQTTIGAAFRAGLKVFWKVLATALFIGLIVSAFILPSIVTAIIGGILVANDQNGVSIGVFMAAGLLFIAGLFMAIRYNVARSLAYYAMIDENLSIMQSLSRSKQLTNGRLIEMIGVTGAASIVPVISPVLMAFGVGSYYLQLKVYRDNDAPMPKIHILSWLPIGLMILYTFVVLFFILLFVSFATTFGK